MVRIDFADDSINLLYTNVIVVIHPVHENIFHPP